MNSNEVLITVMQLAESVVELKSSLEAKIEVLRQEITTGGVSGEGFEAKFATLEADMKQKFKRVDAIEERYQAEISGKIAKVSERVTKANYSLRKRMKKVYKDVRRNEKHIKDLVDKQLGKVAAPEDIVKSLQNMSNTHNKAMKRLEKREAKCSSCYGKLISSPPPASGETVECTSCKTKIKELYYTCSGSCKSKYICKACVETSRESSEMESSEDGDEDVSEEEAENPQVNGTASTDATCPKCQNTLNLNVHTKDRMCDVCEKQINANSDSYGCTKCGQFDMCKGCQGYKSLVTRDGKIRCRKCYEAKPNVLKFWGHTGNHHKRKERKRFLTYDSDTVRPGSKRQSV